MESDATLIARRQEKAATCSAVLVIGNVPDHDEENDMSPLRQRMDDAMVLRGFADRTRETYLACETALAKYYRRAPDRLDAKEIQP